MFKDQPDCAIIFLDIADELATVAKGYKGTLITPLPVPRVGRTGSIRPGGGAACASGPQQLPVHDSNLPEAGDG